MQKPKQYPTKTQAKTRVHPRPSSTSPFALTSLTAAPLAGILAATFLLSNEKSIWGGGGSILWLLIGLFVVCAISLPLSVQAILKEEPHAGLGVLGALSSLAAFCVVLVQAVFFQLT